MRVLVLNREHSAGDADRGAVAIIVAFLAVLILILAAFAADIGSAYAQARQLSVAADADALAAAAAVGEAMPLGMACTQATLNSLNDGKGNVGAVAIARATADALNTANNKSGDTEPVEDVTVSCGDANSIEVTVDTRRSVPTAIAGIIGIDEISPNSYAVARYVRVRTAGGLRPWAACDQTVLAAQNQQDTTFWTGVDGISGPCDTTASGNWGSVDFDGGSNPAGDLIAWTLKGYPGAVQIPSTIPADPGVTNSVKDALESLVGQVVLFPSVTEFNGGGGNNASFDTVGIATVRVCGIVYGNNEFKVDQTTGLTSDCWVEPVPGEIQTTTDDDDETVTASTAEVMPNKSSTLRVSTLAFPVVPAVDPNVTYSAEVTIPGAGPGGKDLTTAVSTFTSRTEVVLQDGVKSAVPQGTPVQITITTTTSTTTITSAGLPAPAPGPFEVQGNKLRLLDHIQFRWEDYSTSSYPGIDSETCDFTDRRCVGATLLWR